MKSFRPSANMSSSSDSFEDLYENAPCGYLTLRDGRIVRLNRTLAEWIGYTPDEAIGKPFSDYLNIAGRIFYETHVAPLLRMQGSLTEVALDLITKSGSRLPVFVSATERRDAEGKTLYTRVVLFKAAERRQYERGLIDSLKDEKHTAELREQFIAVLGHDLRNPLASIDAGARMLKRGPKRDERESLVLDMMQNTVTRMIGLIDDVLDFARGRMGGGIVVRRVECLVEPVLRQVVDELSTEARPIKTHFDVGLPVHGDAARIGQLASNLIGNALTHGAFDKPVVVRASIRGAVFKLSVSNTGKAIPPAALDKLFQPFVRGDVNDGAQGLGLGLYISSEIAKAHGGTLNVVSSDEETRFTFQMPL